jgi:hypothetical protein
MPAPTVHPATAPVAPVELAELRQRQRQRSQP